MTLKWMSISVGHLDCINQWIFSLLNKYQSWEQSSRSWIYITLFLSIKGDINWELGLKLISKRFDKSDLTAPEALCKKKMKKTFCSPQKLYMFS